MAMFSISANTIETNSYFSVYYEDPPKYYIGRVLTSCKCDAVPGDHFRMKFLEKDALTQMFSWPRKVDVECVLPMWIFGGPLELIGHEPFTVKDIGVIDEKFSVFRRDQLVRQNFALEV
jgi:hypothetical protein